MRMSLRQKSRLSNFCDRLGHSRPDRGSNVLHAHTMSAGVCGRRGEERRNAVGGLKYTLKSP